jgi:uncharacterized protein involved in exopolysaccharide biosynthesis
MPEPFDLQDYIGHLRSNWRVLAIACATAGAIAAGVSVMLPKQYTATAKIVIDPPAGSDMRAAMSVSPIYLESLKTYEHFASSDQLFSQAVDRFRLRERAPERSLEAWKSRVLKVTIPRNTKILEINATLEDAKQAHALALYLAEETIKLSRAITSEGDRELTEDATAQLEPVKKARDEAEQQWLRLTAAEPLETIKGDIEMLELRQSRLERELLDADTRGSELSSRKDVRDLLQTRVKSLEQELTAKRALLAGRIARHEEADTRRKSAQAAYEATLARVRDTRSAAGYRGERLKLIDPGIVPEKHSSPKLVLNVGAAVLFAFVVSLIYLSIGFAYGQRRAGGGPLPMRRASTGND